MCVHAQYNNTSITMCTRSWLIVLPLLVSLLNVLYTDLFQFVDASSVCRVRSTSTIALDANVASYILDGAVWN